MCAIFGIVHADEAANLTYLGLHAMQHRGQEGTGIVSTDGRDSHVVRRKGLVADVFSPTTLGRLKGSAAIGHNRYSTTGGNTNANLQPVFMKGALGWVAIAHNGNLVNANALARKLEASGAIFQSTSDTEVILHLMAHSRKGSVKEALVEALKQVEGAYSLLILTAQELIAVRDPRGFRPLVIGSYGGAPLFSSETCAFDLIGAKVERELKPGEMVSVSLKEKAQPKSEFPFEAASPKRCVFETVYFARPDSILYGGNVHEARKALGAELAKEHPAPDADVVIAVPDSGVSAAVGFAAESKLPFDVGIIRSHYIGRTFIEPKQSIRAFGVKLKLYPVSSVVKGKSIVVVDDSLVRGTTSKKLIQLLREAGARRVHMRISAPPTTHPCYYGIDTPTRQELVASDNPPEKICEYIGADSLGYLSLKGLLSVASQSSSQEGFCHACFSGEYPTVLA